MAPFGDKLTDDIAFQNLLSSQQQLLNRIKYERDNNIEGPQVQMAGITGQWAVSDDEANLDMTFDPLPFDSVLTTRKLLNDTTDADDDNNSSRSSFLVVHDSKTNLKAVSLFEPTPLDESYSDFTTPIVSDVVPTNIKIQSKNNDGSYNKKRQSLDTDCNSNNDIDCADVECDSILPGPKRRRTSMSCFNDDFDPTEPSEFESDSLAESLHSMLSESDDDDYGVFMEDASDSSSTVCAADIVNDDDSNADQFSFPLSTANKEVSNATTEPASLKDQQLKLREQLVRFEKAMEQAQLSQQMIHDWDRKMGLKRSHSKTMRLSTRSRKKLRQLMKKEITQLSKRLS